MNKLIIFLLFLEISVDSFCQSPNTYKDSMKIYYLKKSKTQKTTAWILLSGGIAFIITGSVIGTSVYGNNSTPGQNHKRITAASTLFWTGTATLLCSIPLFIASSRNKKNGMSLSFKNERAPQIQKSSFVYKSIPSLNLKINL